ncbi:MAG: HXXEE domain-containing protein [Verrucomicrobiota bacterium]
MKAIDRLAANWVYGGFLCAFVLFALTPLIAASTSLALVLVYLQLPVYQVHQYEEHDQDRFRLFVNGLFGAEVLSLNAVLVINFFGVWVLNTLSILMAAFWNIGFGLIAVYLTLINGLIHLAQAIALRRSNPGLFTSLLLFMPLGSYALIEVSKQEACRWPHHLLGLVIIIGLHGWIVLYGKQQLQRQRG